jgi:hypothetical protein
VKLFFELVDFSFAQMIYFIELAIDECSWINDSPENLSGYFLIFLWA